MAKLLAVGLTTLDILGRPIDALPAEDAGVLIEAIDVIPAGTAGGMALVAAVLGLQAGVISAVGDDRAGRFVRMVLHEHGVDTTLMPTLAGMPTSATILPIDARGRRPTLHAVGASMLTEITEAAIAAAGSARFVHWGAGGGVRIEAGARGRFLAAARRGGAVVTADLIAPGRDAAAQVAEILPALDCFMPSLTEARFLTGHDDPALAAGALVARGARRCIVKLGAAGVVVADAAGCTFVPAFKVAVVDTTSCGDAFCAGYMAALDQGMDVLESCRFAAATAALVAQGLGTLGRLTGMGDVRALLGAGTA